MMFCFLNGAPTRQAVFALAAAHASRDEYALFGDGIAQRYSDERAGARVTAALIRRTLGVVGTACNANTVAKLADCARALEAAL